MFAKLLMLSKRFWPGLSWCAATVVLCGGCTSPTTKLGQELNEAGVQTTVREARPSQTVSLSGVMVEKCPASGCWFRLRDGTGTIRVDTRGAGFVVTNVPLQSHVTVMGKVTKRGDEKSVLASALRY
jgi:uncharacterized protein YdeI (BOF family)